MTESRRLSKSGFRDGRNCAKRLFLRWTQPSVPLDDAARYQIEDARRIRSYAEKLLPAGVGISTRFPDDQAEETQELLRQGVEVIFNATFVTERLTAQTNALIRRGEGFVIREVKSGRSIRPDYIEDAAFVTLVAQQAGLHVSRVEVLTLVPDLTFDDLEFPERMFQIHDVTADVVARIPEMEREIDELLGVVDSGAAAQIEASRNCDKKCPHFDPCFEHVPDDSLIFLPRLMGKKLQEVEEKQYRTVADLPLDFALSPTQIPFCELFRSGGVVWTSPQFVDQLSRIAFPAVFLDFETCRPALPLSPKCPASQQILFQWSAHVVIDPDQPPAHYDHVDLVSEEPHEAALTALAPLLRSAATVLHWSAAEKTTLSSISCSNQSLLEEVNSIFAEKSVDLEKILRDHVLHAKFRGRTSIKNVLAAIQPDAYKGLAISNGRVAELIYVRARIGEIPPDDLERHRADLREYCRQDSLALVDVYQAMRKLAQETVRCG